ncbi:MAG: hypothetical protein IJS61_08900 [Firmicutes bacterium]|nr:hypothetical protein [Bacillota bacterium]
MKNYAIGKTVKGLLAAVVLSAIYIFGIINVTKVDTYGATTEISDSLEEISGLKTSSGLVVTAK